MKKKTRVEKLAFSLALLMFVLFSGFIGAYLVINAQLEGHIDRTLFTVLIVGAIGFFLYIVIWLKTKHKYIEIEPSLMDLLNAADPGSDDPKDKGEYTLNELRAFAEKTRLDQKSKNQNERARIKRVRRIKSELSKTHDDYYASISYEVRTLINSVMGFSDLLKGTSVDAEQLDYLNTIRESGQILMILLNDVLDISKLEIGERTLDPTVFDFPKLLDDVIEGLDPKTQRKSLHVNVRYAEEMPRYFVGDRDRLRRVLFNMLQSVITVSARGDMNVSVRSTLQSGEQKTHIVNVAVNVSHLSVPQDKIDAMVNIFTGDTHIPASTHSGIGLRLYIVQQLIRYLEGEVSVVFKEGKGCEFIIGCKLTEVISLSDSQVHDTLNTVADELNREVPIFDLTGLKILVAEDNDINQKLLRVLLEKKGCRVDVVSSGYEVVEQVIMNEYDIILMDIKMPLMSGIEATRFIRKDLHKTTPIVALTAVAKKQDEEAAYRSGMNDFLIKPIDTFQLLQKIAQWTHRDSDVN
jgi:CheY-like chemotaxis protein/signal transduction histidine kinase